MSYPISFIFYNFLGTGTEVSAPIAARPWNIIVLRTMTWILKIISTKTCHKFYIPSNITSFAKNANRHCSNTRIANLNKTKTCGYFP